MTGRTSEPQLAEDEAGAIYTTLSRVLADRRISADEIPLLEDLKSKSQLHYIRIGKVRVSIRMAEQSLALGYDSAPNKHLRAEMEDLERREQLVRYLEGVGRVRPVVLDRPVCRHRKAPDEVLLTEAS